MNQDEAIRKARDVIRRQHKAIATEESYLQWLRRYMTALRHIPQQLTSEQKMERFLSGYCHADALSVKSPLEFSNL